MAGSAVVIWPQDIESATAKGQIVEVAISGPKAKELFDQGKKMGIEFRVPFAHGQDLFICEVRHRASLAMISFKFPNNAAATDFADELYAARAKILSQCNCH